MVGGSLRTAVVSQTFKQALPLRRKGEGEVSNPVPIIQPLPSYGWGQAGTYDLSFRHNILPETVFETEAYAVPEGIVKRALLRRTNGRGVHHDDSITARAIIESLKEHQPIIDLYLTKQVRA